jgi:hypothetical protein
MAATDPTYPYKPVQTKISRHISAVKSCSALIPVQSENIMKFSLKMTNGLISD